LLPKASKDEKKKSSEEKLGCRQTGQTRRKSNAQKEIRNLKDTSKTPQEGPARHFYGKRKAPACSQGGGKGKTYRDQPVTIAKEPYYEEKIEAPRKLK